MKTQEVAVGMEVYIKGVRSNLNGRRRQSGIVTIINTANNQAVVVTPNGRIFHMPTSALLLVPQLNWEDDRT